MTRSAKVRAFFGDADHDFALLIGQCVELQDLTGCGLGVSLQRIEQVTVADIKHALRLGLVGGGMAKEEAYRLVERNVVAGELGVCAALAFNVVTAAIAGTPDEPLGEPKGDRTGDPLSQTDASDTPTSTAPQQRQG